MTFSTGNSTLTVLDKIWAKLRLELHSLRVRRDTAFARSALPGLKDEVENICKNHTLQSRPFIFAPGLSWSKQLFQRPQQLALGVGHNDQLVFYLEPKPEKSALGINKVGEGVYLVNAPAEVLEGIYQPYLYLLPWSYNPFSEQLEVHLIYDIIDDFKTFEVDHRVLGYQHNQRMTSASLVLVTANRLMRTYRSERSDLLLCPNAADQNHFSQKVQNSPEDLRPILGLNRPIVGYYGAFASWFDYPMFKKVAETRTDLSFVLIGPDIGDNLKASNLLNQSNVYWLGPKSYTELPYYLQFFDVATIPFYINDITNSTSPIKLFEYMAAGKPIVSTGMEEIKQFQGILLASTPKEFSNQIDRALTLRHSPDYLHLLNQIASENTWDTRAKLIINSLRTQV